MAKSIIFSDLLQGSHTTSERQTPIGIMLPLGLLVHQVLSNSEEVMCELLLNWYGITLLSCDVLKSDRYCQLSGSAVEVTVWTQGGRQDHVHHHFVWCNAKSFYCFSPWEKAGLCFQCILKSIFHEKTTNKLLISLYTLLRACTKHLCMWPCSLTENFSDADFFTPLM